MIAPNVVLGAAHCGGFNGVEVFAAGFEYGTQSNGSIRVTVAETEINPSYDRFGELNDFALYRLQNDVFPNTNGITLTVNRDSLTPFNGQPVTTLGLGATSAGGYGVNFLEDVEVFADSGCGNYGNAYKPQIMVCAGAPGKDACQGDSGGPLVVRNGNDHVLVGVVS